MVIISMCWAVWLSTLIDNAAKLVLFDLYRKCTLIEIHLTVNLHNDDLRFFTYINEYL